ncbi:carnitine O-palmitoyltransferase 1, liver isoform [Anabrus simplex]|uniref:carnitine O-palmitoyltransferase 1, liver isoform n=1 Tax=Anabrus simplex TaxID=316456 RepID=UPI0035A3C848
MAEAHSAVAFSFGITHEGWDVNFDREVLHLVWQSGIRSWKKRIARYKNGLKNGVYPAPLQSLWFIVAIIALIKFSGYKNVSDIINRISPHLPGNEHMKELESCFLFGTVVWLSLIFICRYTLRLLLMYKGWMYEERGSGSKISWQTKLWIVMVKIFSSGSRPLLYSFQGSLPRLPVPSLQSSMQKYLNSVRPLMKDDQFERTQKLAEEFQKGIGKKLHRYLVLKSWWSINYVSDWWEEYIYLRGRSPLLVNSNYYCTDAVFVTHTSLQSARAAGIIYAILQFRRLIDHQELKPIMLQGAVPLCSSQYERLFNTTRVPGVETDSIIHYSDSKHIVVYHRGRYYKVIIYYRHRILTPCEIEAQIIKILEDKSPPAEGEEKLAALTAWDRTSWAKTRQEYFFKGTNRQSLDAIEKAAFFVALDDCPYEFDLEHPEKIDHYGQVLITGKGHDRWFDKSFTLCIGTNGRIGANAEHSWGDAAVMSHLWEHNIIEEAESAHSWYGSDGHTLGTPQYNLSPIRLKWELPQNCLAAIEIADQAAQAILNDVDLHIEVHREYGKGFMKQCRISPDAFIQMAVQLAYYRDAGRFCLTYEAAMTRLFREGRTETVRSCTMESSAWVKSMMSNEYSAEERISLFRKACDKHQMLYKEAMCGKAIDRYLFCLYVVSKYLEVDSPFLNEVLREPWRLSTSQPPHGQTSRLDLKKCPQYISPSGGFGPVADDGYGVSYILGGEDILFFHITSKRSCRNTNSSQFGAQIVQALADIKNLFAEEKKNGQKLK